MQIFRSNTVICHYLYKLCKNFCKPTSLLNVYFFRLLEYFLNLHLFIYSLNIKIIMNFSITLFKFFLNFLNKGLLKKHVVEQMS